MEQTSQYVVFEKGMRLQQIMKLKMYPILLSATVEVPTVEG